MAKSWGSEHIKETKRGGVHEEGGGLGLESNGLFRQFSVDRRF